MQPDGRTRGVLDLKGLYLEQSSRIARLLRRLGIPRDDIGDVTQDAFVRALRFTEGFDTTRPPLPWLLSIVRRSAADYWRGCRLSQLSAPSPASFYLDPSGPTEAKDLLQVGFLTVHPLRRQVVEMHDLLGFSVEDISIALGLLLATTYSHLRLGRLELAAAIRIGLTARDPQLPVLGPLMDPAAGRV